MAPFKNDYNSKYRKLFNLLHKEKVETWFDLCLLLDRIKDSKHRVTFSKGPKDFFKKILSKVAFVSFDFGVDGASIEVAKYGHALERLSPSSRSNKKKKESNILLIGGHFTKETKNIFPSAWQRITLLNARGFNAWDGYDEYFKKDLDRGDEKYNSLIKKIWKQVIQNCIELSECVIKNKIQFLIPVNVNSNPGNVSLALSLILVSEYLEIPVWANHHDFYWDGGKKKSERVKFNEMPGIRDHFFTNAHIGEVFSIIEQVFPWDGQLWFHGPINGFQAKKLISNFGLNPLKVSPVPTAVDVKKYKPCDQNERSNILKRLNSLFSGTSKAPHTIGIKKANQGIERWALEKSPVLIGAEDSTPVNFRTGNLLFLQPTRILQRKKIEVNFNLVEALITQNDFHHFLQTHKELTVTLLVTGPVANVNDQMDYLKYLVKKYESFLNRISSQIRDRIFLAFAFGLEKSSSLMSQDLPDLNIHEIFSIASIVTLPSESEGRGLPIIESCSAGVPIVCRKYNPIYVYSEVVGHHLGQEGRLKVFEFNSEDDFCGALLNNIVEAILNQEGYEKKSRHNREAIKKRFSISTMEKYFTMLLFNMYQYLSPNEKIEKRVKDAFSIHRKNTKYGKDFSELVFAKKRVYGPGFAPTEFMIYLKSLIDPSFFRVEEMELRGRVMEYSLSLVNKLEQIKKINNEEKNTFLKHLDALFKYNSGKNKIVYDHSISYRHRSRNNFPYRKLTEHEICGIVGIIFRELFTIPDILPLKFKGSVEFINMESMIKFLVDERSDNLIIDDSKRLAADLEANKEIAFFNGHSFQKEINLVVLTVLRKRLGLSNDQEISKEDLAPDKIKNMKGVTLFCSRDVW